MGGLIVYSAVVVEPRLSTAVTMVSSPEWWGLEHTDSPHYHPEKFSEIKLLSITGGRDTTVPNKYTISFHEKLRAHFSDYSSRLEHKIYPASDHMMNPDWDDAWNLALMWFENYL